MIRSLLIALFLSIPSISYAQTSTYKIVGIEGNITCWVSLPNITTGGKDVMPVVKGFLPTSYVRNGVTYYDYTNRFAYLGNNEEVAIPVPYLLPPDIVRPEVPKNDKAIPAKPEIKPVIKPEVAPKPTPKLAMPKPVDVPSRNK